jgi:tetratricopeptide (TPR) repeat protein
LLECGGQNVPVELRAGALRVLGNTSIVFGDADAPMRYYEQSLAEYRQAGDDRGVAIMLQRLALQVRLHGDAQKARALADQSLRLCRQIGFTKGEAVAEGVLGTFMRKDGDAVAAVEQFERSVELADRSGFWWWKAWTLLEIAEVLLELGRLAEAGARARAALPLLVRMGDRPGTMYAVATVARLAAEMGDPARAGRFWGAIEAEEARAPAAAWEGERDEFARLIQARASGPEYERGRAEGRALSLEQAVAEALQPEPSRA